MSFIRKLILIIFTLITLGMAFENYKNCIPETSKEISEQKMRENVMNTWLPKIKVQIIFTGNLMLKIENENLIMSSYAKESNKWNITFVTEHTFILSQNGLYVTVRENRLSLSKDPELARVMLVPPSIIQAVICATEDIDDPRTDQEYDDLMLAMQIITTRITQEETSLDSSW